MTNKHKKSTNPKKSVQFNNNNNNSNNNRATTKPENNKVKPQTEEEASPSMKLKTLTRAQLSGVIFVSIGVSKILEFSATLTEGTEDPKTCMSYLIDGETTCQNSSFGSLVLAKYYSALILTGLVISMMLQLWNSETTFLKLMTCLCISPLATTVLSALYCKEVIPWSRVWHLIQMSFILFATCFPTSWEHVAFLPDRPWTIRSLPSLTLLALAVACSWDVFRVVRQPETTWQDSLVQTAVPLPEAARAVVVFWIVDKISMTLLYLFAIFHFPEWAQKTLLLRVAVLKGAEYMYQLPKMTEPYHDVETVKQVMLASIFLSSVAWITPSIAWKKKI